MSVIEQGAGLMPGIAASPVISVETVITSAELLALHNTPQTVIPNPGPSRMVVIDGVLAYKPAGTAYGGIASSEDLDFRYINASGALIAQVETTGFLDQAGVELRWATGPTGTIEPRRGVVVVSLSGAITTGTSPLHLRCYYRVLDTAF